MASASYQVERYQPNTLAISLKGELDEETLLRCERDTRAHVGLAKAGSVGLLWDLRDVCGYSIEARAVLVRLQQFLAEKAHRTVYVASRPEPRSLALWAVHMTGHWHACISPELEAARAWLSGRGDPDTGVRPLASTRPPPGDPRDKAAG